MSSSREEHVYMAKLAEQAERYEEMVDFVKKLATAGVELTVEERNLLSVAYKNVIGARRASRRILASIEQKEANKGNQDHVEKTKNYRNKIEAELVKICHDILDILSKHLIVAATSAESKVFYYKMRGDYYRYLAEFQLDKEREASVQSSLEGYQKAEEIANKELEPTDPIRLALALNFSVFYYEIMDSQEKACQLAKKCFDEAVSGLDNLDEDQYKDSTLILQLLRDNLTLWTNEGNDE